MKKEIREVTDNVLRVTTLDERWYVKPSKDIITGLPSYDYKKSVTWVSQYYPKGIAYYKWLANKGWDEAESLKIAAGEKGSKVHKASEDIEKGVEIPIDAKYLNPTTGKEEELVLEEVDCIVSFRDWLDKVKPELLAIEMVVFGDGYGGTLDRIYRYNGFIWIVDLKTSQYIWPSHEIQLSAYSHADIDYKSLGITDKEWANRKLGILQLGYRKNKAGYKFTEIEDKFDLFLVAMKIWANENPDAKPKQKDYPLTIKAECRA